MAVFLDEYYGLCESIIGRQHGKIVKFMGDVCLAVFAPEYAESALA